MDHGKLDDGSHDHGERSLVSRRTHGSQQNLGRCHAAGSSCAFFVTEGQTLLQTKFKNDYAVYFEILSKISAGKTKRSEIQASFNDIDVSKSSKTTIACFPVKLLYAALSPTAATATLYPIRICFSGFDTSIQIARSLSKAPSVVSWNASVRRCRTISADMFWRATSKNSHGGAGFFTHYHVRGREPCAGALRLRSLFLVYSSPAKNCS